MDCAHANATNKHIHKELNASKERVSTEIENLECDECTIQIQMVHDDVQYQDEKT
jgi:hypothetical protein